MAVLLISICAAPTSASYAQMATKIEIVVLKDGIYDSLDILNAINKYGEVVKSSLGLEYAVDELPSENNSPQGIDTFIESRHEAGAKSFILVGNDLRWPLSIWEEGRLAMPSDGVLCDTDGELTVVDDGLHQPMAYFTAETSVSYIFPPANSLSADEQCDYVVQAFNKFEQYHRENIIPNKRGVISGRFNNILFSDALEYMDSASNILFGKEGTVKKELNQFELIECFEQFPAFFGAAGHGSPRVVETSSSGDVLGYSDLETAAKTPLLLEIFGCWTAGWDIQDLNQPWSAAEGFLSEASILKSGYTIALIAGFPESSSETSFSNLVLSEIPFSPESTLGELMIGKQRRSGDWILFGDPALKIDTDNTLINRSPKAFIDYLSPNPVEKGTIVYFSGRGEDYDGKVISYDWSSSLEGHLSSSAAFSSSSLSPGTHTVYFKVQDNHGDWSEEVTQQLTVTIGPAVEITSPLKGTTVRGTTLIRVAATGNYLTFIAFYVDNSFRGYDDSAPYEFIWDTASYANGQHKIQAKASYRYPTGTLASNEVMVIVDNPLPTVAITAPTNGSTVAGVRTITVMAEESDKVGVVNFYVDGVLKGYDYGPTFEWSWNVASYADGPHKIRSEAYYKNLQRYVSSETVTLIVNNTRSQSRTVTITSLSEGMKISETATISITATGDGLRYIYLYVDENWVGYSERSSSQFSWNTLYLPNGLHKVSAVAIYGELPPYIQIKSETNVVVDNSK